MAEPRFTPAELAAYRSGEISVRELARRKGKGPATISRWLKDPDAPMPTRSVIDPFWPWEVASRHINSGPYTWSRDYLRTVLEGTSEFTPERLRRLRGWLSTLIENREVLAYDPSAEPTPWRVKEGGFHYLEREATDGDSLIRVPAPAWWTPERRRVWRIPATLPGDKTS